MISNQRRRREMLILAVLLSSTTDIVSNSKFKMLYHNLYRHINVLDQMYIRSEPNKAAREKETAKMQMVVNAITPGNYGFAKDEWKLWFLLQVLYRLVGSGWPPPREPELVDFIQSMYHVSQNYNLENPPPASWLNTAAQAPERLRKAGYFVIDK